MSGPGRTARYKQIVYNIRFVIYALKTEMEKRG
jgi:hypothetical protein